MFQIETKTNDFQIVNSSDSEIFNLLNKANKIVICIHISPDGDAIGSSLALYHWALYHGKEAVIFAPSEIPENLYFLPDSTEILVFNYEQHSIIFKNADLVVIADLNDSTRLYEIQDSLKKFDKTKILIDHHSEPKNIADYYFCHPNASSTAELIFKILKNDSNFKNIPNIAACLYTGLMMDTGAFRFPSTNSDVFSIASQLVDMGSSPAQIYDSVYNTNTLKQLHLLGNTFKNAVLYHDGRFVLMCIRPNDFKESDARVNDIEDFAEKMLCMKGVLAAALVTQFDEKNEIRISFRSKDNINIRQLALKFGGGGHQQAAGARVYNTNLDELITKIIEESKFIFDI